VPLVICNLTICLAYLMLLLSFVFCIMHPIVSCKAARATGLLPYAIINSLAVSTDHWFPLKTAVAQYPRQVPKPPKKTATRDRNTDNKVTCFYTIGLVQVITVRYFTEKVTDNHNLHIINRKKHLFFTTAATKTV